MFYGSRRVEYGDVFIKVGFKLGDFVVVGWKISFGGFFIGGGVKLRMGRFGLD